MGNAEKIRTIQIDEIRWNNVGAWFAIALSKGLVDAGHEVVFIAKGDHPPSHEARKFGIPLRNDFSFQLSKFYGEAKKIARIAETISADFIVAHRSGGMNLAIAARKLMRSHRPAIIRARYDARPVREGIFNKWIHKNYIDGVIVPNKSIFEKYNTALEIPAENIRVLIGGVDADKFKPLLQSQKIKRELDIPDDSPLVGLVARLDHVKGHDDFLKAASIVSKRIPGARFAVIGEEINISVQSLKNMARELGIDNKIVFIGKRNDIEKVVGSLDVGVVSSTGSEALSRVALEYMACGLPVVATKVGGIPDVIEDCAVGHLVEPGDAEAMAQATIRILENAEIAARFGNEGRARVLKTYSRNALAKEAADFFAKVKETNRK